MAQQTITEQGSFTADSVKKLNDNFTELYTSDGTLVVGPASVTSGKVAVFSGTTGKLLAANSTGVSAGPFTTITSITVVNGLVTALTGS